jgi:hypothetical protein
MSLHQPKLNPQGFNKEDEVFETGSKEPGDKESR